MKGDAVDNAHPVIRIFSLCENMKWTHLPVAGGLYDQHPDLIDGFDIIFRARAKHEAEEQRKREEQTKQNQAKSKNRVGKRRA